MWNQISDLGNLRAMLQKCKHLCFLPQLGLQHTSWNPHLHSHAEISPFQEVRWALWKLITVVSPLSCAILSEFSEKGPFPSSVSQLFQNYEVSLAWGPPLLSACYTFLSTQNLEAQVVMEGLSPADILYKKDVWGFSQALTLSLLPVNLFFC